jgi:23S rRNA (adenine2503-C2)-methyltransferase
MTATSTETIAAANAPLKKQPLETYVPPAKPSLIGLSRADIADRLGEIGVAPAQRKMRTQQLWHWMYFRGAKSLPR